MCIGHEFGINLWPLHTQDWEPKTITLQALSLVEKVEPIQVHFTLRLRDQQSMWMQGGCKSLHGFLHGIMFHGHLDCFQNPPLGGRPNTKPEDHGTLNAHNYWFIIFYHVWGLAWIDFFWNSIWLKAWSHMASHYTWGSMITIRDFGIVLGRPWGTFFCALTISWSWPLAHVWSGP